MCFLKKLKKLEKLFLYITSKKYTDISKKKQLLLCLQSVKEDLEVKENFKLSSAYKHKE